ncbi:uncharacterized protein KQ657_000553 [Scheffersomyces spartinae]|uniref:t-SNARE coiled-coil homology domain-containing protein n=1 Tax=Scheffersomyces spartinae TaxID=45513 RepID=A0A9P8AIU2_9ASCO|nr:uncharacterized protein KQ657_000553 [Scheffersomyces spartinae]KAG7193486.1 hypothetical protein KQ657_000553 [Scheffersomyces spartinae]
MSFANSNDQPDIEDAQDGFTEYPEFSTIAKRVEDALARINTQELGVLREAIKNHDNTKGAGMVEKVTQQYREINDWVKSLSEQIEDARANHEDVTTIKYLQQKEAIVIKLVKNSITRFRELKNKIEAFSLLAMDEEQHQQYQQYQHQQEQRTTDDSVQINYEPINSEELEQQTLEIQQREREIHRIQQDTSTINEIFQNLQSIVEEQQVTVDSIEANLYNYNEDARGASHELRRAERYQRRAGGRMACCLIILLVVAAIVMLGILL